MTAEINAVIHPFKRFNSMRKKGKYHHNSIPQKVRIRDRDRERERTQQRTTTDTAFIHSFIHKQST